MKMFWALILGALPALAGSPDYRLVGTNLYDFSQTWINPGSYALFGTVIEKFPHMIKMEVVTYIGNEFVLDEPRLNRYADSEEMLRMWNKFRFMHNNDGSLVKMRAGDALLLGLDGHYETVERTAKVYLLNYEDMPHSVAVVGAAITRHAVPTRVPGYWDCGIAFAGDPKDFKVIYRVLPDRIVAESQCAPEERQALRLDDDVRLLAWQRRQATNDDAYAQFQLGKRYLTGAGVQTNLALARLWLTLSAKSYAPASQLLEALPPSRSGEQGQVGER